MNKKNNKGFSLIELIVVVAIMAVLVGVLAPTYLKYVENSRIQKDVSAVGEVVNAVKVAMADEKVNTATTAEKFVVTGGTKLTFSASSDKKLEKELASIVKEIDLTSNAFKEKSVTISVSNTSGDVTIEVTTTATDSAALEALGKLNEYKAVSGE